MFDQLKNGTAEHHNERTPKHRNEMIKHVYYRNDPFSFGRPHANKWFVNMMHKLITRINLLLLITIAMVAASFTSLVNLTDKFDQRCNETNQAMELN